jgi:PAS domain S-box-containing protein
MKTKPTYQELEERIKELKEREEFFLSMIENSPAAISIINPDTTMSMVNKEYCKLSGYSKDEVIGMSWTGQVTPTDLEKFKEFYLRTKNDHPYDTPYKHEFAFYKKDGELRHAILLVINLSDNKKMATFVDVTENKKVELALKESETRLRESNHTKNKLFNIIAHDLRSPFNAILGFSSLILENHTQYDEKEREKYIKVINNSAKQAFCLLDNLLNWARTQTGKFVFNPKKQSLDKILKEVKKLNKNNARMKNIKLSYSLLEDINIYVDYDMMEIILRNLISNAIKFTHKNGEVTIKTEQDKDNVIVSISDTGIGMSQEKVQKIFDIGEKISTAGTENEKGTGLGLILCKEFVEKHGGEIWVESEIEKGSKFIFSIPNNYN